MTGTAPTPAATATAAKTSKPTGKRVEPAVTAIASLEMPTKTSKRGSVSLYPFDSLTAVGQCFGVKNKTAANLASIVSNANRKNVTEVTAADGTVTKNVKAHFFAHDVDAEYAKKIKGTALEDSTVLVFRDK